MVSAGIFSLPQGTRAVMALAVLLMSAPLASAQVPLRGSRNANAPGLAVLPGKPLIPLLNNGSLQISPNPNPQFPNALPFTYIAALPLGDRLMMNGIQADPDLLPQALGGGGMGGGPGGNPGGNPGGQPGFPGPFPRGYNRQAAYNNAAYNQMAAMAAWRAAYNGYNAAALGPPPGNSNGYAGFGIPTNNSTGYSSLSTPFGR